MQARAVEPAARPAKAERHATLLDPGLQLLGLRLRDSAGFELGVDLVDRSSLRRVLELLGRDAQVACDPGEKALVARRAVRGDRASRPDDKRKRGSRDQGAFGVDLPHRVPSSGRVASSTSTVWLAPFREYVSRSCRRALRVDRALELFGGRDLVAVDLGDDVAARRIGLAVDGPLAGRATSPAFSAGVLVSTCGNSAISTPSTRPSLGHVSRNPRRRLRGTRARPRRSR